MAFTSMNEVTKCSSRHSVKEHQKVRGTYYHQDQKICWQTFAYLPGLARYIICTPNKFLTFSN